MHLNFRAVISAVLLLSPLTASAQWQSLGTHWVVVRDAGGAAVSIKDLSYPGVFGQEGAHVVLGQISPTAPPAASKYALGGRAASVDWWRTVPWKTKTLALEAPRSFALSDIDFSRATRDPARFAALTEKWNQGIRPAFLDDFKFVRGTDGSYEIQWHPAVHAPAGFPLQVVELSRLKANLWRTLGHQTLELLLGEVTGLITLPFVSALLGTAVDRYFHWTDLLVSTREEALGEMLADPPPQFELSAAERERAGEALLYAETSLLTSPRWLWQKPARQWKLRLQREARFAAVSRAWLAEAGADTRSLDANFDWEPSRGRFFLSGGGLRWAHAASGPVAGLDAAHPDLVFLRRLGIEASTVAVIFASTWLPYVGGAEVQIFKALVEAPENALRRWEARLSARLEEREARLGENWEPELAQLIYQQENPFELSRPQSLALIARRRAGLSSR